MAGMLGKDVVTQPQPAELSKDGEHPEVEQALKGEAACQEENDRCRSGLVESEKSL